MLVFIMNPDGVLCEIRRAILYSLRGHVSYAPSRHKPILHRALEDEHGRNMLFYNCLD